MSKDQTADQVMENINKTLDNPEENEADPNKKTALEQKLDEESLRKEADRANVAPKTRHTINIGGKDFEVIDSVTVMEIRSYKLEDGQELQRVIAMESMMVNHKKYMVRLLTNAITEVMCATKRENMVKLVGKAGLSALGKRIKKINGAFGGKKK